LNITPGESISVELPAQRIWVFPADDGIE
jgi:hypothetical protein